MIETLSATLEKSKEEVDTLYIMAEKHGIVAFIETSHTRKPYRLEYDKKCQWFDTEREMLHKIAEIALAREGGDEH